MKTSGLLFSAVLLVGAGGWLHAQPAPADPPYSALCVFGDSWSGTTDGPYGRSRWSNGPMWPETLSTHWSMAYVVSNHYAKGGATTSDVASSQVPRFAGTSNLRILRADFHDRWDAFLDEAVSLGFVRTDLGALQDPGLKDKGVTGPGKDYVFWDAYHPTSRTHDVWAGWFGEVATQTRTESLRLRTEAEAFTLELSKLKPGRVYALEVSSNLVEWAVHESITADGGTNTVGFASAPANPGLRAFRLSWAD